MDTLLLPILVLLIALVAFAVLRQMASRNGTDGATFPFERRPLFTAAERSFLGVLEQAVDPSVRVFGKVRLGDLVKVRSGLSPSERKSALNRVQSKHVDFVLCAREDLRVLVVVELDDKSHRAATQQRRDAVKDGALTAAGVPIHRFSAKAAYSVHDVRQALGGLGQQAGPSPLPAEPDEPASANAAAAHSEETRRCPRCGSELVRRVSKRGPQQGSAFLGCGTYPSCRYTLAEATG